MTRHSPLPVLPVFATLALACVGTAIWHLAAGLRTVGEGNARRHNVVLISIDSLRQDHLGAYGRTPEFAPDLAVSPNLDRLTQRGTTFEDAWTTSSWTLPAHAALMTGQSDRSHGVEDDGFALHPDQGTLAEQFSAAGYRTAGIFSGPYLSSRYGFDQGFDSYSSAMMSVEQLTAHLRGVSAERVARGLPPLSAREVEYLRDRVTHWDVTSPRLHELAVRFLEAESEQPFFLFLHYFDTHYDYLPDEAEPGLAAKFDPDYGGHFEPVDWHSDPAVRNPDPPYERRLSERDLAHARAMYDAEIHWVDRHVGMLLEVLKQQGLAEDTIVCVLSDHGDEFFDHGGIAHRSTLFPELTRIPLILAGPGIEACRVREQVQIIDVPQTLLDAAGVRATTEDWYPEGRSLTAALEGRSLPQRSSLHRILSGRMVLESWRDEQFAVLRQLVPGHPSEGLLHFEPFLKDGEPLYLVYDRREDPAETAPLPASDPRYARALAGYAARFQLSEEFAAGLPSGCRLAPPLTPTEREKLEQLGYVSDEAADPAASQLRFAPFPAP